MEDENLFDYQYTMLDSPEPARLVINLDAPETSGDANCINNEQSSACKPLPSFDTFSKKSTMSDYACWYKPPSVDDEHSSTGETAEPNSDYHLSKAEGALSENQESSDRSFDIDNLLGKERHCYSPRHSTPAKESNTFTHQVMDTGSIFQSNQSVNTKTCALFNMNSLINASNQNQISAYPSMYKRKEDKPPYSYVAMAIVAILNSDKQELTLAESREKLGEMFPFFRGEYTGWKSSLRHALTNSKCFYKIQRKDENEASTVCIWKVNTENVKHYTFSRQSKGPKSDKYKLTLQEELGLPPFINSLGKGIKLPPKPCFGGDSVSLAGSVSEDILNTRNDSVPTPYSIVSDTENADHSTIDKIQSLKHKREDIPSTQQTTKTHKRQTTTNDYPSYGYQQYSESSRPYDPSHYSYFNQTSLTFGRHWSRDFNQYGYQQQYGAHTMNSTAYSNEIQAVTNMWWTYYNGMIPNTSHTSQNTNSSGWYNATDNVSPIDLTKCGEHKDD